MGKRIHIAIPLVSFIALASTACAQTETDRIPHASQWLKASGKAGAQVPFQFYGAGTPQLVSWGVDTAWDSEDNVRRGTAFIGSDNMTSGRISFQPSDLVDSNGNLSTAQKEALDSRIKHIKLSGTTHVTLNCDHEALNSSNYYGKPEEWYKVIKASVKYAQAQGLTVDAIAPFNEPDYTSWGEGTQAHFKEIARLISEDSDLAGIRISAGNTLNCDQALSWYNYMKPYVSEGNTHQLAGSFDSYATFFQTVVADGNHATADELHNVGEAIVGAEYGMQTGIWWGFDGVARGNFCKATTEGGARLGYAENRTDWTAAAVYRLPDGRVDGFIGTSERQALPSTYEFVSTDEPVYFDGYGPVHAFTAGTPGGSGYQNGQTNAEKRLQIVQGEDVPPFKLEGGTYVIMNKKTRQVITIKDGSYENGASVVQHIYSGTASKAYQQWKVSPIPTTILGDLSYSYIRSARDTTSMLDLLNWSLNAKSTVIAYKGDGGNNEQWYLEYAGDGDYYIRSHHSALYLEVRDGASTAGKALQQNVFTGTTQQRWRFIPIDAERELSAPAVPTGLKATPLSASVQLSWTANAEADLDGYMVLRGETVADSTRWSVIGRKIAGTQFIDNSCQQGKSYVYKIKAIDRASNMSAATDAVTAKTSGKKSVVARYEFEDNTQDLTANQFDAVSNGTLSYQTANAKTGRSLRLSGSSYIQLPAKVADMEQMTIAVWAYWQGGSNWQRLFDFGNDTDHYMFLCPSNGSEMRFVLKDGGDEQILSTTKLSTRKLTHLAVTLGRDAVKLYVNGELKATSTSMTIRPSDFAPVLNYVGRSQYAADPYFNGYLDDLRIFNYELSADEVKDVYENTTDGIASAQQETDSPVVSTEYYSASGARLDRPAQGLNIVKQRHADHTVSVKKVLGK